MNTNYKHTDINFTRDIIPQINKLTADCFRAVYSEIDPNRRLNSFEIFGLDFMLDSQFNLYLIEVNTNPLIDTSSPFLLKLMPSMIENALRLVVHPLFPPPPDTNNT